MERVAFVPAVPVLPRIKPGKSLIFLPPISLPARGAARGHRSFHRGRTAVATVVIRAGREDEEEIQDLNPRNPETPDEVDFVPFNTRYYSREELNALLRVDMRQSLQKAFDASNARGICSCDRPHGLRDMFGA
eukprot:tig00021612_g22892.t1